jgi:hypothetical protein
MTEDLVDRLWSQAKLGIAKKIPLLRGWQAGEIGDGEAWELTHQLVGTLGSYRRFGAASAARELQSRLELGGADAGGDIERELIEMIESVLTK